MTAFVLSLNALSREIPVDVSVDTTKSRVAEEACKCGAQIINDISGLTFDADMARVCSRA